MINKTVFLFTLLLLTVKLNAQFNKEALSNYKISQYEEITDKIEDDAIILFDRSYFKFVDIKSSSQVQVYQTIHRKIKIRSLYGLEKYNKLYISTFEDLGFKTELVTCRAKILKKAGPSVTVDSSSMVTTTLPANVPFLYKVDGNFKMLALNNLNIGDEIEYLYTIRSSYHIPPEYFYKFDRVNFSNENYCLEKSLFFSGKRYNTSFSTHNFNNNKKQESTDYDYVNEKEKGQKISLTNIKKKSTNLYVNSQLDQPYIFYSVSHYDTENNKTSWESFAKNFKPLQRESKKTYVFNGESFLKTVKGMDNLTSRKEKFNYILERINHPLENNFHLYDNVKDDIEAAFSYAKAISSLLKVNKLAANFHFVVNRKLGEFDESNVSLYQFDNILVSFVDEDEKKHYFSLLEPYSTLGDVHPNFQNTKALTIIQDEEGKRSFSFDLIPNIIDEDIFHKEITVNINSVINDSLYYNVKEEVSFKGDNWIKSKPYLLNIITDTLEDRKDKELKRLINDFLISSAHEDTLSNIQYKEFDNSFNISYEYKKQKEISSKRIISFKADDLFDNNFYTPYSYRSHRDFPGYIYNSDISYQLNFKFNKQYKWIENTLLKSNFQNNIGEVKTDYTASNESLSLIFQIDFKKIRFEKEEWEDVILLRDQSFNFLNSNLYFSPN